MLMPIVSVMVFSLVIGAMVMCAAIAAHDVQHASNRPVRYIWIIAILATMALSAAAPFRGQPATATPITGERAADAAMVATAAASGTFSARLNAVVSTARRAALAPVTFTLSAANRVVATAPSGLATIAFAVWIGLSLLVTTAFLMSYRQMVRRVRRLPVAVISGTPVRVSPDVGPAVVGLAPPVIVIPYWLRVHSPEEQHIVVTHEAEHIRSRDPWLLAVACALVAIMPWNLALWYALSRMRLAIEIDCDRRVLRRGVHAQSYGALLIGLSAARSSLPVVMPAFPGSHSHLKQRIIAMTARPSPFLSARRIAGALVALTVFVTACESTLPTAAQVETMDVASAEKQAVKAGFIDSAAVIYFVDEVRLDEQAAKAISAERIASVKVSKARNGGVNEVRIATKQKSPDSVRVTASGDPLVIIDGKIAPSQNLASLTLTPDEIASIDVVKGEAATRLNSDPRAANGIIMIVTKKK